MDKKEAAMVAARGAAVATKATSKATAKAAKAALRVSDKWYNKARRVGIPAKLLDECRPTGLAAYAKDVYGTAANAKTEAGYKTHWQRGEIAYELFGDKKYGIPNAVKSQRNRAKKHGEEKGWI
jgi:hypothetical protein